MKIEKILSTEQVQVGDRQLTKTSFFSDGQVYYTFAKIKEGDEREEESRRDFTKPDGTKEVTIKFKSQGGFGGKNDPRTQEQIIRQNALTNAVQYNIAKANLMAKGGKAKEAINYLNGKQVVQTATFFAQYSNGLVTVVNMNNGDIKIEKQNQTQPIADAMKKEPENQTPPIEEERVNQEEVDINDIPNNEKQS